MDPKPLPVDDLREVLALAETSFRTLRGARIFVTGGTGFFGHWLLESLVHANRELGLDARATVLTRDAARFRARSPWTADEAAITLLEGDVRSFAFPSELHSHIVHAATDSAGQQQESALTADILTGTRRVLEFAHQTAVRRLLYVSTGAVYGRSTALLHTPESYLADAPPLPAGTYEGAKRAAEELCLERGTVLETELNFPLEVIIARCFAFVGPHLPLDKHFAIGNFIGSALAGQPIHVKGDGSPRRSWLYMSDLAVWLWTLLAQGQAGRAYNVGSDESHSIAEAARLTAATLAPGLPIQIDGMPAPGAPLNSYVPAIDRARTELGLEVTVPLANALVRTAAWCG
jgi:dTDP-glucose 4,6-dehydratase